MEAAANSYTDQAQRKAKRRLTDEDLREVAEVYGQALAEKGNPTQAVADHFFIARSTAGNRVMKARKRGFLKPTTPGRAG